MSGIESHRRPSHGAAHVSLCKLLVLIHWDWGAHAVHQRSFAGLGEHRTDDMRRFFFRLYDFLFDC